MVTKRSCKTAFIVKGCEASKSAPRARPRALRSGARPRGRGGRDAEATGPGLPGHGAGGRAGQGRAGQGRAGLAPVRAPDPTRLRLKASAPRGCRRGTACTPSDCARPDRPPRRPPDPTPPLPNARPGPAPEAGSQSARSLLVDVRPGARPSQPRLFRPCACAEGRPATRPRPSARARGWCSREAVRGAAAGC